MTPAPKAAKVKQELGMEDILSCPFCLSHDLSTYEDTTCKPVIAQIKCTNCWAIGPEKSGMDKAIRAWNRAPRKKGKTK